LATKQGITQLAETTGFTRETVKKRLDAAGLQPTPGPHGGKLYDTPAALAAVYEVAQGGETPLATAKIANLDADTRLKELREARERGDLIPSWVVEQVWGGMTGAARAHLLGLPYKLGVECQGGNSVQIENKARELIYAALDNLNGYDPAAYLTPAQRQGLSATQE
jgi:hypothetical protein